MKTINLNNNKDLLAFKESFNKKIDAKISEQALNERIESLKNSSFGELKVLFESILDRLYDTDKGKKLIGSYIKTIKENKSLKTMYKIYEQSIKNIADEPSITAYLISDVCNSIDKKMLAEGERKIYDIWTKGAKLTHCDMDSINEALESNKILTETINYLTRNKKNANNLFEMTEKIKTLSNIITENTVSKTRDSETKTPKELFNDLNATLNENTHEAWERKVIEDLTLCDLAKRDRKDLFESYKQDCINTIDELTEDGDLNKSSRLYSMKQQLNEKVFNEETLIDDLFKLSELKQTLLEA